jgi:hypothetical protein
MVDGWKQRTIALVMLNTASAIGLLAVAPRASAEVKSVENLSHATSIAIAPVTYSAPPDAGLSEDGYLLDPGDRVKVDFLMCRNISVNIQSCLMDRFSFRSRVRLRCGA